MEQNDTHDTCEAQRTPQGRKMKVKIVVRKRPDTLYSSTEALILLIIATTSEGTAYQEGKGHETNQVKSNQEKMTKKKGEKSRQYVRDALSR